MKKQHKRSCKACPWRKDSMRGWLGESDPIAFLSTSEAEHRMPCHLHVDYEAVDWQEQASVAPQCAGRAVHFANRCKLPRNPDLITLEADRDVIFTKPQDFIDHHTLGPNAPQVVLLGAGVIKLV